LVSCASINQSQFLEEKYIGKFTLTQNNKNSNFNIAIFPSSDAIIIQVNKPLLGNVLNVTIDKLEGITVVPKSSINIKELIESLDSAEHFNLISKCLDGNQVQNNLSNLKNNIIYFECLHKKEGSILINIKAGSDSIKGVISRYG